MKIGMYMATQWPQGADLGQEMTNLCEQTRAAKENGFDSVLVGQHFLSEPLQMIQAEPLLARLAVEGEGMEFGIAIVLLAMQNPVIVAEYAASLDWITGGKYILGVGVGYRQEEFVGLGVPFEERRSRFEEAIPLIRRLWTGEEISHDGPFYEMHDVKIHPAPVQPGGPPIIVAGRQEVAMRRAVRHGDGWMPYLYSPRRYAASVAIIAELAEAEGRDLGGFGYYAFVFVNVDPDGDAAREGAAACMGGNYNQDFRQMVDNVAAAGTPAEVTAKLLAFVDAGARHFIFTPATRSGNTDDIVARLLGDVVPAVRAELAARTDEP